MEAESTHAAWPLEGTARGSSWGAEASDLSLPPRPPFTARLPGDDLGSESRNFFHYSSERAGPLLRPPHVGASERARPFVTSSLPHPGGWAFSLGCLPAIRRTDRRITLERSALRRLSGWARNATVRSHGGRGWARRQSRGSGSQSGGDLNSPESGPVTRHIFAGSEAEEQRSPGRAGPRRLRPPASAPSSSPATSNSGGQLGLWSPSSGSWGRC